MGCGKIMYTLGDTITAISTPLGEGGIGIVRMSGPEVLAILEHIFRRGGKELDSLEPRRLCYGHILDSGGEVIDEVLVSYMKAPHTYTREDVVEINCHGGIVPLRRVLELTLQYGARPALPGEMTLRAFLNGRLDLAQAEAVLDIVRAKTEASLRVAMNQLEGRLSQEVRLLRSELLDILAYLEATIDFDEEDIPPQDITGPLKRARERVSGLLAQADQGIVYRQGLRMAIVGRPNVGKSSLLNALLGISRAIVTPIPGTTRDTLEETLNLRGIPIILVDTAGIAETEDLVESLGVERSRRALEGADLVLLVVDGSEPWQETDSELVALVEGKAVILVINKADLPLLAKPAGVPLAIPRVEVSALTGEGLERLQETILEVVFSGKVLASDSALVTIPRHRDILRRAVEYLDAAQESYTRGMPADCVAIDVTAAVNALGEITGETATEDLLDVIFSNFCIGK